MNDCIKYIQKLIVVEFFLPFYRNRINFCSSLTCLKLLLMMCQRGSELLLQAKRANARTDSALSASKYNGDYRIFAENYMKLHTACIPSKS